MDRDTCWEKTDLRVFQQALNSNDDQEIYQLSDIEKSILSENQADYESGKVITNEEVISRNEEWLKL